MTLPPITNDPATWPTGDNLWSVARAIAFAEGANIAGSNPDRLNNPGDISDDYALYGGEPHSGSDVTRFPDKQTGWNTLRNKLYRAETGLSKVYHPQMTWQQLAQKWAANWQPWLATVTARLGVQPSDAIGDYYQ
jgi:hypothetical protein